MSRRPAPAGSAVLRRSTGRLATAATARMESDLTWFRDLSAQDRSWVGLIVQAGIQSFTEWYAAGQVERVDGASLAASVFGAAPRALTGVITLQQTVDLVRLSIDVIEANLDTLLSAEDLPIVHEAVGRYAREVAFATAEVYARAAEQRGAWDARLEALVVDAVLRGETDEAVLSRAGALGWAGAGALSVVVGNAPEGGTDLFDEVRRLVRTAGLDALCALHGDLLVVLLGGADKPIEAASLLDGLYAPGPVVAGPIVSSFAEATISASAALAGHRASAGWPDAPRPVLADDLLPERVLAGDATAADQLVSQIYLALDNPALVETLAAYLDAGGSLEATARALFVHANTVRYRLRQVADATGLAPTDARDAWTLRIALTLGRQRALTRPL
ncbi:PucR family transcriptional regulator [Nocardioides sp. Kera G14]|uniref:PucR family transcriptional regulator n=1 Tax=Nocardioides sp. Kera G14 TaxID=2884264 RepID=UPI001D0FEB3E|nr:helix-turn-helix domain-containing protein [Nocardioides sp. Kera G14]UDY24870.1 helix-turn-helix domain-containing protein [Nocardioides sp. Kera G14]